MSSFAISLTDLTESLLSSNTSTVGKFVMSGSCLSFQMNVSGLVLSSDHLLVELDWKHWIVHEDRGVIGDCGSIEVKNLVEEAGVSLWHGIYKLVKKCVF